MFRHADVACLCLVRILWQSSMLNSACLAVYGGGLITLIRDNITFTTTDIPSTINTHNIELQMVKVHPWTCGQNPLE